MKLPHSSHTPFWFTRGLRASIDAAKSRSIGAGRITAGLLLCGAAQAHEGHGLPGVSHWHSTDVLGFVMAAVVATGVAIWMKGRGK